MPLDAIGYLPQRVLTPDEARDLAILKAARHRIRHPLRWWGGGSSLWRLLVAGLSGGTCAMLATKRAAAGMGCDYLPALRRLAAHLPPGWDAIHLYNDHRSTTHADVLQLFDRAIAELE